MVHGYDTVTVLWYVDLRIGTFILCDGNRPLKNVNFQIPLANLILR